MKARMVAWINEKTYRQTALSQAGEVRTDAWVVNATGFLLAHRLPDVCEPVPACRTAASWCASNVVGFGRAPGDSVLDDFAALARTHLGYSPLREKSSPEQGKHGC